MSDHKMNVRSKRSDWKLKGFYLRPETARRLRSYVNRLQEDNQKIDASDVVDQALAVLLQAKTKDEHIVTKESDLLCGLNSSEFMLMKHYKTNWGNWVFNPDNLTIVWKGYYEVDLEQINSSAKMLDWVFQCQKGRRADDLKDLVAAFKDIFHPQANCCSFGDNKAFSGSELAKVYRQKAYPERFSEKKKRKQLSSKLRYSILERDGFRCNACGISASDGAILHVDHRTAVVNGGSNDPSNLQALCSDCNLGKGAR
jgi:hypothetical protein